MIKNGYIQGEKFYLEVATICLLKLQKKKMSTVLFCVLFFSPVQTLSQEENVFPLLSVCPWKARENPECESGDEIPTLTRLILQLHHRPNLSTCVRRQTPPTPTSQS